MSNLLFLNKSDIIEIHERLVADAINSNDPISPAGIKNDHLLESALSRQQVGYGNVLKYNNPISNAATLCYGICCNHPMHNGNKRTALVALLCHLDRNGFTFKSKVDQNHLYSFMLNVASHSLLANQKASILESRTDLEINSMTKWLIKRTRKVEKGERSLSYVELERILRLHDIHFENQNNNYVDVVKYKTVKKKKGWFGYENISVKEKVANIPYWPGRTVGKILVKSIRKQAGLTHADGIDSAMFYGSESTPDDFIQKYKKVLRKLAKT